jgi:putative ABC transport system permease protein
MAETKPPLGQRLRELKGSLAAGTVILLGIGGIAAWLAESPKVGAYFAGGLLVSLIVLSTVAAGLLRGVRAFLKNSPWRLSSLVRQGLANLYRPGNQAQAILVALGLGVMFTVSVYLVQKSLVTEIIQTAPPGTPNVYFIESRRVSGTSEATDRQAAGSVECSYPRSQRGCATGQRRWSRLGRPAGEGRRPAIPEFHVGDVGRGAA